MTRRFRAKPKNEIEFRNLTESLRGLVYCTDPRTLVPTHASSFGAQEGEMHE